MNKKLLAVGAFAIVLGLAVTAGGINWASASSPMLQMDATPIDPNHLPTTITQVEGVVIDSSKSLPEMASRSDLIVIATVTEQTQYSPVSIAHKLTISRTVKGTAPEDLTVFQLGILSEENPPEHQLALGETYFLFLGKQTDSSPNTYYIKGRHEGMFKVEEGLLKGDPKFTKDLRVDSDPFAALEETVQRILR